MPGELTTEEPLRFIDSLAALDRPAAILVITGGDSLMRPDIPNIAELYREHPLLREIRAAAFHGECGRCEYRELCGGSHSGASHSGAFAATGDPLAEDPACAYVPAA